MTTPPNDPGAVTTITSRTTWFRLFGYDATEQEVVLRADNGTASADEVWLVLTALRNLERDRRSLWVRTIGGAQFDRAPFDPDGLLKDSDYGPLMDKRGEWVPGRREIVKALTLMDDDGVPSYSRDPLERKA